MSVHSDAAPQTAAYFLDMVDRGVLDNTSFYRSASSFESSDEQSLVIQGGAMFEIFLGTTSKSLKDLGLRALKDIESTKQSGLRHQSGTVSFARDLAGSGYVLPDFFICFDESPQFDAGGRTEPDTKGFPAFATVIEGLDVALSIAQGETRGETPVQPLKGQILTRPISIERAVRI